MDWHRRDACGCSIARASATRINPKTNAVDLRLPVKMMMAAKDRLRWMASYGSQQ